MFELINWICSEEKSHDPSRPVVVHSEGRIDQDLEASQDWQEREEVIILMAIRCHDWIDQEEQVVDNQKAVEVNKHVCRVNLRLPPISVLL